MQYKFIVDDQWVHDPLLPTIQNALGSVNNLLHVSKPEDVVKPAVGLDLGQVSVQRDHQFDRELSLERMLVECVACADIFCAYAGPGTPPGEYGQVIPDLSRDKAPQLPPQLLQVTLNSDPIKNDPTQLPEPNHVSLNHLFALSIKVCFSHTRKIQQLTRLLRTT